MGSQRLRIIITVTCLALSITGVMSDGIIEVAPVPVAATVGSPAKLNCTITLNGDFMHWEKVVDGEANDVIYSSSIGDTQSGYSVQRTVQGSMDVFELTVNSVSTDFSGFYVCRLLYSSHQQETAEVIALSEMRCLPPAGTLEVPEGDNIKVDCEVDFYGHEGSGRMPALEMEDENGQRLGAEPGNGKNYVNLTVSQDATKEFDELQLICSLSFDGVGAPTFTDSCSTYIHVLHPAGNVQFEPDYYPGATPLSMEVGEYINCTADGRPQPEFLWRSEDEQYEYPGWQLEVQSHMVGVTNTYFCIVNNEYNVNEVSREVVFYALSDAPDPGASSGTDDWVIAVAVVVPLVVIGAVVGGVFFYIWYKRKNASPKSPPPSQIYTGSGSAKPTNHQVGYPYTKSAPPPTTTTMPGYTNLGGSNTSIPAAGRDSPGFGDLGIRHLGNSQSSVNANPAGTPTTNNVYSGYPSKPPGGGYNNPALSTTPPTNNYDARRDSSWSSISDSAPTKIDTVV